ncbi:hypothetical protein O9G_003456 [Rozella allomycis CSF55]|uniref:Uncharacterized protein n=1 Tax=Rozella allomycis (strain CSF55) TaxID=988480 RepID=A0A075AYZ5_ROZAC|nr:hypothetical protein O9G_003456 [Rozella allomycis CSF55]|eukprot:EPZ33937.1 hypothetical protein O9G_003456 [Rozella allomycis CSF55]
MQVLNKMMKSINATKPKFITRKRPDLCFALNLLSRFHGSSRHIHWLCLKRLRRYLKGTPDVGICLGG